MLRYIVSLLLVVCAVSALGGPIHEAALYGDLAAVTSQLKADPKLIESKDGNGATPLLNAALNGHLDVMGFLLSKGADIEATWKNGAMTALHTAAADEEGIKVVEFLLLRGVDINKRNNQGATPLHLAARTGSIETVKILLNKGADYRAKTRDGETTLDWATKANRADVAELIQAAIAEGKPVKKSPVKGPLLPANASVFTAVNKGNLDAVRALVKKNPAIVNAVDKDGTTPLHFAAASGQKLVADYLLANGANVSARKNDGVTPLHIAASLGKTEIAGALLAAGADPSATDKKGRTPIALAEAGGHKELADLLKTPAVTSPGPGPGPGNNAAARALKPTLRLTGHSGMVWSVAFSPASNVVAGGAGPFEGPGEVRLWGIPGGASVRTLRGAGEFVTGVAFTPDGKSILSCSQDKSIRVYDVATGTLKSTITADGDYAMFAGMALSADGTQVAGGCIDGTIRIWELATKELKTMLTANSDVIRSVAFSPDGTLLASASQDMTARIWDLAAKKEIRSLPHDDKVTSVAFSPDGKLLATGCVDQAVYLWDAKSGEQLRALSGHAMPILAIAFSPDGKRIAGGSSDETVMVWGVEPDKMETILCPLDSAVHSAAFSPDGKWLAAGLDDGSIALMDMR